jgi:hypothetical protein
MNRAFPLSHAISLPRTFVRVHDVVCWRKIAVVALVITGRVGRLTDEFGCNLGR